MNIRTILKSKFILLLLTICLTSKSKEVAGRRVATLKFVKPHVFCNSPLFGLILLSKPLQISYVTLLPFSSRGIRSLRCTILNLLRNCLEPSCNQLSIRCSFLKPSDYQWHGLNDQKPCSSCSKQGNLNRYEIRIN